MKNSKLALLLLVLLTGCAPKVIKQEVMVACVAAKDIPAAPVSVHDTLSAKHPLHELYGSALIDKGALEVYSAKLRVLVQACSTLTP